MLQCSLWLRQPAALLCTSRLLLPPYSGSRTPQRRPRVWKQPDVRQLRDQPTLNRLQGVLQLSQRSLPDPASHRGRNTFQADAQAALLSRPGGRTSRLSDQRATFHYAKQHSKPRLNPRAFRKFYNAS